MVDLELLEDEFGLTQEFLRDALGGDLSKKTDSKDDNLLRRSTLQNRIKSRIDEGMNRCFEGYRVYYALDLAWDTPFRQVSPTLVQSIMDKDPNSKEVLDIVNSWGLQNLITSELDPKTQKETGKKILNLPIFWNIFVPLVRAYVTIRWAKIVNDRRLKPHFKFEPAKLYKKLKVKCDIVTDRVEVMSNQFNYFENTKQATLKMLHYGDLYQFPKEEWYTEEQWRTATDDDVANGYEVKEGETIRKVKRGDVFKKITIEGLRPHHPHPSRTYRDIAHAASTFNTDTGAEFGGYWKIIRYREIAHNKAFYNSDKIPVSDTDIMDTNRLFFQTVYGGCTLKMPISTSPASESAGIGSMDREKKLGANYYGVDMEDQGILVTEHFEKLYPKRDGLVNPSAKNKDGYDCPVWFRFVVAGQSGNILYAAPLPGCPVRYMGYDADGSREKNSSLSLEVLPFQDHAGNIISQMLLSMKQNLVNLTLVDEDQLSKHGALEKISSLGQKAFNALNIFSFSGSQAKRAQHQVPNAIQSFSLPKANIQEQILALRTIIEIMERVLVMSSQEVGQAASHEQTREEIRNISSTSSSRQVFTATAVDQFHDAFKEQIYTYLMAYGSKQFYADIPCDREVSEAELKEWGFTYAEDTSKKHKSDRYIRVKVDRSRTAMPLHSFAATRDGDDRINDGQIAQTMSTFVLGLLSNPMTAQAIGPEQAIAISNVIAQYAGLPRDFKLRSLITDQQAGQANAEQQQAQMQEALKQMAQQILEKVGQEVPQMIEQTMKPVVDQTMKNSEAIGKIMQALQIAINPNSDDTAQQPPGVGPSA